MISNSAQRSTAPSIRSTFDMTAFSQLDISALPDLKDGQILQNDDRRIPSLNGKSVTRGSSAPPHTRHFINPSS